MAQAPVNNTKLKPSLKPDDGDDDETKQQSLTKHQILKSAKTMNSFFASPTEYNVFVSALMDDIRAATAWLRWLTDENEVENFTNTPFAFFEWFRDAKYLCNALNAILPKDAKQARRVNYKSDENHDRRVNYKSFVKGCKALGVVSRFVIERTTLYSKRNITTADVVDLLCNIYAFHIASHEVKHSGLLNFRGRGKDSRIDRCQKITNNVDEPDQCLSPMRYTETIDDDDEKEVSEVTTMLSPKSTQVFEQQNPDAQEAAHEPPKITDLSFTYVGRVSKEAEPRMHGFGKLLFKRGLYIGQFQAGEMHGWGVLKVGVLDFKEEAWKTETYDGLWEAGIWMGTNGSTSDEIAETRQKIATALLQTSSVADDALL